jgi:hypothetical protein
LSKQRIFWTEEMDYVIIESIKETGEVGKGLRQASDILKTSYYNVRNRWYIKLKRKYSNLIMQDEPYAKPTKNENPMTMTFDTTNLPLVKGKSLVEVEEEQASTPKSPEEFIQANVDEIIGWLASIKFEKQEAEREIHSLQAQVESVKAENAKLREDYTAILKVINQARMQYIKEEELVAEAPPRFKMERNGNLVVVAD